MKREFLKGLGLTDEVIEQIMAEHGKAVHAEQAKGAEKDGKITALETEREGMQARLAEANRQLEGYDPEWKTKAEAAEQEANKKIEQMQFDYALEAALSGARAKNAKAVRALLNLDGLKLSEGQVIGLKEQLEEIRQENDFLFESDKPVPEIVLPGNPPVPDKAPDKMTYSELCTYLAQNPDAEI